MKPNTQTDKEFSLSNEYRIYFGLNPVIDMWEVIELKPGVELYFEGNTIKKIIERDLSNGLNYKETDNEIHTVDREMILPKTSRGKLKKLTPSNIGSLIPTGCVFSASVPYKTEQKSSIHAYNIRNRKRLPITEDNEIKSIIGFEEWLKNYCLTCPPDYLEKVDKFKNTPHITVKYQTGNIFRFEIDREHYGFGIIIGEMVKLRKDGIFSAEHVVKSLMTVPLMIRFFLFKTKDKNVPINQIIQHGLMPTDFVSDDDILWGVCEIIGLKDLDENDIEFPIQVDTRYIGNTRVSQMCWGPAHIESPNVDELIKLFGNRDYDHRGVSLGMPIHRLVKALDGKSVYNYYMDIRHEDNQQLFKSVYEVFGLPLDISYDEFNTKYGGMSRQQYLEHVNKSRNSVKRKRPGENFI